MLRTATYFFIALNTAFGAMTLSAEPKGSSLSNTDILGLLSPLSSCPRQAGLTLSSNLDELKKNQALYTFLKRVEQKRLVKFTGDNTWRPNPGLESVIRANMTPEYELESYTFLFGLVDCEITTQKEVKDGIEVQMREVLHSNSFLPKLSPILPTEYRKNLKDSQTKTFQLTYSGSKWLAQEVSPLTEGKHAKTPY